MILTILNLTWFSTSKYKSSKQPCTFISYIYKFFFFYPSRHFLLSLHPSGLQIGFLQRMRFLLVLFLIHLHLLILPCTTWMESDPWKYDVELDLNVDVISFFFSVHAVKKVNFSLSCKISSFSFRLKITKN